MKNIIINIAIFFLIASSFFLWYEIINNEYQKEIITGKEIFRDNISIKVFFCPKDNCEEILKNKIENSKFISCAFYDLGLESIIEALEETNSKIIIDRDYEHKIKNRNLNYITDNSNRYMHNKFCIFDNKTVFTGSMNPTNNDANINANNIVFIDSKKIAENYLEKFNRMFYDNEFKRRNGELPKYQIVKDRKNNITLKTLFCPESRCEDNVINVLTKANESIYFMHFSFTSLEIGNLLIEKLNENIEVKGIFENWLNSNSQWSRYGILNEESKQDFILSRPPGKMHHKVFIIDEKIIITGSYNPSNNGNLNNDENIVIIYNEGIAKLYKEEFDYLWVKYEKNI